MDIIKQITFLLWVLVIVILTPIVLRHFDIDVKTVYRKVLFLDDSSDNVAKRDALASPKTELKSEVFNELFQNSSAEETPEQKEQAQKEFEKMMAGLKKDEAAQYPQDHLMQEISGIPMPFRHEKGAEHKVHFLPPPPGFATAETFSYLVYREKPPISEKLKKVLDTIHGNLMLDLTPFTLINKPDKILVMLFDNRNSYMNYTKRPAWSGAASDLRSDTMYVLEGPNFYSLSVHELTHLYFDGYFLPSISPLWLSEGIAVYMQIFATKKKPGWLDPSLERILEGEYIPLEQMMQMDDISSLSSHQAELWYTQAYSVVDYLLNSRSRDEFYHFCNELKAGTPAYSALYRAYGMPFTKISVLQNVWLYDLSRKMGAQTGTSRRNVPAEVLSSTQTVRVPVKQTTAQPSQPQKTVIPKLKMVETNGYKGNF